jgi:hypothetical protein
LPIADCWFFTSTMPARRCAACDTRVSDSGSGSDAFAIFGFGAVDCASNAAIASRSASDAATGVISAPSASRSLRIARAWSCDTRDSFTPSSAPISFIVTSL